MSHILLILAMVAMELEMKIQFCTKVCTSSRLESVL